MNNRSKYSDVTCAVSLAGLAVLLAAAAPFIAARVLVHTSAAQEIGYSLLMVALVALVIDSRS